ncbi:MAG: dTDP-6-deoxy-L-hexose 3-O-methyltransferase, partial [Candidatus Bathyarchaeota archaeon]|nr:dTDP-6-deoxy-L-hexose 3-O-methyltransferase [Candidatus Bathyarchaeota archaeon]
MGKILFGFDIEKNFEYENGFYLTSDITRIGKLLAHYELYKLIIDLPGNIIECGVYKGTSLIRFSSFREILESPYSRKIIGFDAFGKFPEQQQYSDASYIKKFESIGGFGISVDELKKVFQYKH